jgi:hypothetical protein
MLVHNPLKALVSSSSDKLCCQGKEVLLQHDPGVVGHLGAGSHCACIPGQRLGLVKML